MVDLAKSDRKTMSSREVAELTGKRHADVMRDLRTCEQSYLEVFGNERRFALVNYTDAKGEQRPEYMLNKSQTLFLVSGYDAVLRAKIQKRWEELEAQMPKVALPTRRELALMVIEAEDKIKRLEVEKEKDAPLVRFAETAKKSDTSILVRQLAKIISNAAGVTVGQNRLFYWLRLKGYLNRKNEPYQKSIDMGLFDWNPINIVGGVYSFEKFTPRITGKGQVYFVDKYLKDHGINRLDL